MFSKIKHINHLNSSLRIHSEAFEKKDFLLQSFEGIERLSQPFEYHLRLFSKERQLNTAKFFAQAVSITIEGHSSKPRSFHGLIADLKQGEMDDRGYLAYQFKVVPALWFMKWSKDYRRFEKQSLPEILNKLSESRGLSMDLSALKIQEYPKIDYLIQSNETILDFFNRILAEGGLYYYFAHTEKESRLVVTPELFKNIEQKNISASIAHTEEGHAYDLNEIHNDNLQVMEGKSRVSELGPGLLFNLTDSTDSLQNKRYALIEVKHSAQEFHYTNRFNSLSYKHHLKPTVYFKKNRAYGHQSANVNKINVDKEGKIKATFFWQQGDDLDLSQHPIQVLQSVAGNQWGAQWLPRFENELMVRFCLGDPNQPIVVGALYNAIKKPFYKLSHSQYQNAWVTQSLATSAIQHELVFDDTASKENYRISSGKDFHLTTHKKWNADIKQNWQHSTNVNKCYQLDILNCRATKQIQIAAGSTILITPHKVNFSASKIYL